MQLIATTMVEISFEDLKWCIRVQHIKSTNVKYHVNRMKGGAGIIISIDAKGFYKV